MIFDSLIPRTRHRDDFGKDYLSQRKLNCALFVEFSLNENLIGQTLLRTTVRGRKESQIESVPLMVPAFKLCSEFFRSSRF